MSGNDKEWDLKRFEAIVGNRGKVYPVFRTLLEEGRIEDAKTVLLVAYNARTAAYETVGGIGGVRRITEQFNLSNLTHLYAFKEWDDKIIRAWDLVVDRGDRNVLEELMGICPKDATLAAARMGDLVTLRWLRARGCDWESDGVKAEVAEGEGRIADIREWCAAGHGETPSAAWESMTPEEKEVFSGQTKSAAMRG